MNNTETTVRVFKKNDLLTHEYYIVKAFESMDLSELERLLDEEKEYDEKNKWAFINILQSIFEKFHRQGDTCLVAHVGNCNNSDCKLGCYAKGYLFEGNNSGKRIAYVFDNPQSNIVENICSCINFKAKNGKEAFFLDETSI